VETFVREDGKVFPTSMNAGEIRDMLRDKAQQNGFVIQKESSVTGLSKTDGGWYVSTERCDYLSRKVILATGGCSYPSTGSDGSILGVLKRDLDIEIIPPKPALAPLPTIVLLSETIRKPYLHDFHVPHGISPPP